ncbi:MAG: KamA family radical SAM protein [Chitinivibrionales bacterium]|nr:KamA family radical SAM protein [Chitinivibrionales bacterium]
MVKLQDNCVHYEVVRTGQPRHPESHSPLVEESSALAQVLKNITGQSSELTVAPASRKQTTDVSQHEVRKIFSINASSDTSAIVLQTDGNKSVINILIVENKQDTAELLPQNHLRAIGKRGINRQLPKSDETEVLSLSQLRLLLHLSPEQLLDMCAVDKKFPMKIPRYYAQLMKDNESLRPIMIPSTKELIEYADDSATDVHADESTYQPVEGIVHRYPGKLLFFPTLQCFGHCRFCFRAAHRVRPLSNKKINAAIDYIRNTRSIREVLITGGDPLTLSVDALDAIMTKIRGIDHVEIIRIGTRALAYAPSVITPELTAMLSKHKPVFMTLSFVHPDEITPYCEEKLNMLADSGVVLLQQGPLLKGINDDAAVLKRLYEKLAKNRVLAYYAIYGIYAPGVRHFIVDKQQAKELFKKLENNTSGHCLPHLITLNQNDDKTRSVL